MSNIRVYDQCQSDTWKPNMGPNINPTPLTQNPIPYVVGGGPLVGALEVLSIANENMGGGLVSHGYSLPTDFTPLYFGANFRFQLSSFMLNFLGRKECDLKITLKNGASGAIANQLNGSNQLKPIAGSTLWSWQVDPDGKGWIDSGYQMPVNADSPTEMQVRWSTNGSLWSILQLWNGSGNVFIPKAQFQSVPLITTNWTAGMLAQLQAEVQNAPASLAIDYLAIQVVASDAPVRLGWF